MSAKLSIATNPEDASEDKIVASLITEILEDKSLQMLASYFRLKNTELLKQMPKMQRQSVLNTLMHIFEMRKIRLSLDDKAPCIPN